MLRIHKCSDRLLRQTMQGLTERQRQILDFISTRIQELGYPPTIREIGEQMGIRSTNGVNDHLKALERKGYLKREGLKSRALRPVKSLVPQEPVSFGNVLPAMLPQGDTVAIPVLGRVAAGAPILAEEHVEATVHVDSFFLGRHAKSKTFALRVTGDSMINAGIFDGDYIFVRKQLEARPNDIVVAMIDGEATVKRFVPQGDKVLFVPENDQMEPIVVRHQDFRQTSILGIVCGVYRRMG